MNREDIKNIIFNEDIEFIHLHFTDIFGIMKKVTIPANEIERALNNEVFLTVPL